MPDADDVDMRQFGERAPEIDGIRRHRIVVARQDQHGPPSFRQQLGGAVQDVGRLAVVVEHVAHQQHEIGVVGFRRGQHHAQAGGAVLAVGALMRVAVNMQIGTMDEYDVSHGHIQSGSWLAKGRAGGDEAGG